MHLKFAPKHFFILGKCYTSLHDMEADIKEVTYSKIEACY